MNHPTHTVKTYITTHTRELVTAALFVFSGAVLIALFIYNNPSTVVYQPANACGLFTPAKAQELLGEEIISLNTDKPVLSGDIATSKCSYTNRNPDQNQMLVAAIAVRSGVNDKGVQQNKTEFAASQSNEHIKPVKDLGESAYYNQTLGQLNILNGREWIIISYGIGSAPEANTVDKAVELARKILT